MPLEAPVITTVFIVCELMFVLLARVVFPALIFSGWGNLGERKMPKRVQAVAWVCPVSPGFLRTDLPSWSQCRLGKSNRDGILVGK
jgi:hypothetical protein